MDTQSLPDEKARLAGNIKGSLIAALICMAATALFVCLGATAFNQNLFTEERGGESNWLPFVTLCLAAILTIASSAAAWCLVIRDKKSLVLLRESVVHKTAGEQPGVWPPPPHG